MEFSWTQYELARKKEGEKKGGKKKKKEEKKNNNKTIALKPCYNRIHDAFLAND